MQNDNKNTLMFIVSAFAILIGYQFFILGPQQKKADAELQAKKAAEARMVATQPGVVLGPDGRPAPLKLSRDAAKAQSPRVAVDTPALSGSIALKGGRIDDLWLKTYAQTTKKNSPPVELFRPEGAEHAWFADFGWAGANLPGLPDSRTLWTTAPGQTLTPTSPVVMTYDNGQGLIFTRTLSVDADAMFTVADTVRNQGAQTLSLAAYATVQRQGIPDDLGKNQIVHEGAIGVFGVEGGKNHELKQSKYGKWKKDKPLEAFPSKGGWAGITDKYWLTALIPDQSQDVTAQYRVTQAGAVDIYDVNFVGPAKTLAPGQTLVQNTRLFAGAKTVPLLRQYEFGGQPPAWWKFWDGKKAEVPRFDDAVDWGMFSFFTRPIFNIMEMFYKWVGNFGGAILLLTVALKLVLYPLADKSYESMAKMKKIAPEVEKLKAKFKDDPTKQQQEMMALYGKEKINPMMGCLPMLIQIPVFYSLYKVLTVTIEMRHAPFFGWIQDLSAPEPTSLFNLFGLIPYDPGALPLVGAMIAHLGIWPLLYGVTMWLTTAMNPPAADPIQQKIFQWFPVIFTFTLSGFAVGLVIYWCWSNVLTIFQQYIIMRRYQVENPIDQIIARFQRKPTVAT
ncbi:membrane protein insertase YidC [Caulobacter sp. ErkDOM-YI]|uniref:membrane protein insertase YidC n=1 Tax=unclassified Caulobacter TaxID=2648921 RepID=UPI003AF62375